MAVPLAPVWVLAKGRLPRVSYQSCLSPNDKGDTEMILGNVNRSPAIYLTTEETPGKLQLGDRPMNVVRLAIPLNGVLYLQMRSLG